MRLSKLLAQLDETRLRLVASKALSDSASIDVSEVPHAVDKALRRRGHVEQVIRSSLPPVFAVLRALLEAEDHRVEVGVLKEMSIEVSDDWCRRVTSGQLLGRDDQCRIYRRLLRAALQSELSIDSTEAHLLGLLRQELGMTDAEHFLLMHHRYFHAFWRKRDAFDVLLTRLKSQGVLFSEGEDIVLPEEFVSRIRDITEIHMSRDASRELYGRLSNGDLRAALGDLRLQTSGSKGDRVERLVDQLAPPRRVLATVGILDLRDLAKSSGAKVAGKKEDLVQRLVDHFENGGHKRAIEPEVPEIESQPRILDEARFKGLFDGLTGYWLGQICRKFDLPHTGNKARKIDVLWRSHLSEESALGSVQSDELRRLCELHGLNGRGSKPDKIGRLIARFSSSADHQGLPSNHQKPAAKQASSSRGRGDLWTDEELEVCVSAYLEMLELDRAGKAYRKAEFNRDLRSGALSRRSKASVEYRMENISSVLDDMGRPFLKGYLPKSNVGGGVAERIRNALALHGVVEATGSSEST